MQVLYIMFVIDSRVGEGWSSEQMFFDDPKNIWVVRLYSIVQYMVIQ